MGRRLGPPCEGTWVGRMSASASGGGAGSAIAVGGVGIRCVWRSGRMFRAAVDEALGALRIGGMNERRRWGGLGTAGGGTGEWRAREYGRLLGASVSTSGLHARGGLGVGGGRKCFDRDGVQLELVVVTDRVGSM